MTNSDNDSPQPQDNGNDDTHVHVAYVDTREVASDLHFLPSLLWLPKVKVFYRRLSHRGLFDTLEVRLEKSECVDTAA